MTHAAKHGDPDLVRVEEAGLNALQTQRQLFYDGWLLRLAPSKARRARSVNAHFGSTLPLAQKIRYCERAYAERHLPVLFRITPFVQPADLGAALVAHGYEAFDPTLVQVARLAKPPEPVDPAGCEIAAPSVAEFADALAQLQGLSRDGRDAVFERSVASPLRTRALVAYADGAPVAAGTVVLEDGLAGVFSMATAPAMRRRGVATALLARLLVWAWERSATHAYLQVDAENAPALAVYRKFGFATAYTYHYCGQPGASE
ncbi:MAG: GNAT family N-acetyltransferase [Burkholderiales bacterium]